MKSKAPPRRACTTRSCSPCPVIISVGVSGRCVRISAKSARPPPSQPCPLLGRPFGAAGPGEAPAADPGRRRQLGRELGSWFSPHRPGVAFAPELLRDPLQLTGAALQGRLPLLH